MKNEKGFIKGCLVGIIFTILLNVIVGNIQSIYRRVVSKNLTVEQKMKEIQNIVEKASVNEFDEDYMLEGMFIGMVATLNDPYSYYMSKETFEDFLQSTDGNYVGIGIMISVAVEGSMEITSVFPYSPAEDSGLLIGDKIIDVDGEKVTFENYDTIVSKIKGEEGSTVELTIYRESTNETLKFEVLRKNIQVPTVEYEMLEDNIAYISISQFDGVTLDQFKTAFYELSDESQGMIIDLRNNPGGLLSTVCEITDLLVPEGIITYIEDKYGNKKDYRYSETEAYNKPLVILVNGNSASASEVLSGAVKDYGVGYLVGEQTYGKGVVQNTYPLSDGSGIKVTIAKYYTPNGICIDGEGIAPDYYVVNDNSNFDLQLETAVEVIKGEIGE